MSIFKSSRTKISAFIKYHQTFFLFINFSFVLRMQRFQVNLWKVFDRLFWMNLFHEKTICTNFFGKNLEKYFCCLNFVEDFSFIEQFQSNMSNYFFKGFRFLRKKNCSYFCRKFQSRNLYQFTATFVPKLSESKFSKKIFNQH